MNTSNSQVMVIVWKWFDNRLLSWSNMWTLLEIKWSLSLARHVVEENKCGDSCLEMLMDSKLEHFINKIKTNSEMQFSTQVLVDLIVTNKYLTKLVLPSNPFVWINDSEFTTDAIKILGALQLNWNLLNFSCIEFHDQQLGTWSGLVDRFIDEKIYERNKRQVFINKLMTPILMNRKLTDLTIHFSN